jgi:hypothetical protein
MVPDDKTIKMAIPAGPDWNSPANNEVEFMESISQPVSTVTKASARPKYRPP